MKNYQSFTSEQNDQQLKDNGEQIDQNQDYPFHELSGDEAMESSFSVNSLYKSNNNSKSGKTSIPVTSIVIAKTILGVGILGLPYVFKQFGLILTIVLIILFYFQTQYCTKLLLKCKNMCGRSNLSTIGYATFNQRWIITFINVIIIVNNFGLCFAEMTIQGTAAKNLMIQLFSNEDAWYSQRYFLSSISALIMLPMMIIQKIERLKHVGMLALLAMAVFTITIIVAIIQQGKVADGFQLFPQQFDIAKAFGAFPTLLLAFNWEFNLFPVFKGMTKPTDHNLFTSCYFGMGISTTFYLVVGILGYAIYGNVIDTNFLANVTPQKQGEVGYFLLNLTFYFSTVLTTPLVFYGARNNFLQLIKSNKKKTVNINADIDNSQELLRKRKKQRQAREKQRFYFWSITTFILIVIGAITIDSLEVAFNIVGSVSSNSIGCVLPSLFYYKLVQKCYKNQKLTSFEQFQYQFARVFFIYSVIMSIVCLTSEFKNQLSHF